METKIRVVVYVPQMLHKRLKSELALEKLSVSKWFRQMAETYVELEPGYIEPEKISEKKIPNVEPVNEKVLWQGCCVYGCKEEATATGKQYEETSGEWVEMPMCKRHAALSLKEMLK